MSTTKSQDQMKYTATGDFVIIRCSFIVPEPETRVALIVRANLYSSLHLLPTKYQSLLCRWNPFFLLHSLLDTFYLVSRFNIDLNLNETKIK